MVLKKVFPKNLSLDLNETNLAEVFLIFELLFLKRFSHEGPPSSYCTGLWRANMPYFFRDLRMKAGTSRSSSIVLGLEILIPEPFEPGLTLTLEVGAFPRRVLIPVAFDIPC